ncbi:MAG: alpha/beta fold hydrolase [Streptosporangiaceae bacterium]
MRPAKTQRADGQLFELDGVSLWGKVSGSGRPVVLLHGVTANAYVFDPVASRLADSVRVIAVDQRGHGRTGPAADGDYSAAAFARDVARLAEVLGEPVIVAGHSLGSRNAIEAAARYPAAVAGVAAIDFTPYLGTAVLRAVSARVARGDRRFAGLDEIRVYLRERYPRLPPDAVERRARYGYRQTADGEYVPLADPAAMRLASAGLSEDLAPALAKMTVPAVLVRGADSTLVSPEAFRRTRELRPDLPAVEIAGADHYVPEERPHDVAGVILQLAARIERS